MRKTDGRCARNRMSLLKILLMGPCTVNALSEKSGLSRSATSTHITDLRTEGIVFPRVHMDGPPKPGQHAYEYHLSEIGRLHAEPLREDLCRATSPA